MTIIIGIVMAILATYGLGMSMNGWWILGAIGCFSPGEMMSGPGTKRAFARSGSALKTPAIRHADRLSSTAARLQPVRSAIPTQAPS